MIKEMVGPDVSVMTVVKANGYGHGAVGIAPTLIENGSAYLAVATLTEALDLKRAYPDFPVFILGHTPDRLLGYVVDNNITQTIFDFSQAQKLNELASEAGKKAAVHIKVDTGFHRLGKEPSTEYAEEILKYVLWKMFMWKVSSVIWRWQAVKIMKSNLKHLLPL